MIDLINERLSLQELRDYEVLKYQFSIYRVELYQQINADDQPLRYFYSHKESTQYFADFKKRLLNYPRVLITLPIDSIDQLVMATSNYMNDHCLNYYYKTLLLEALCQRIIDDESDKDIQKILEKVRASVVISERKWGGIRDVSNSPSLTKFYQNLARGWYLIDSMKDEISFNKFYQFNNLQDI